MDIDIMERAISEYTRWIEEKIPLDLKNELLKIVDDNDEIFDRFCKDIEFGTSGLRGKMGAGSNRINSVVIRKTTRGIAAYIKERFEKPCIVIGYDTRINSKEYAQSVAEVFCEEGVDALLFCEPTPVPVVSFAVRYLGINGGIMITASHNPKEYNGYKVYDHFGNQIDNKKARKIEEYIKMQDPFAPESGSEKGAVEILGGDVKEAYLAAVKDKTLWWSDDEEARKAIFSLNVCYTPLNGAGLSYVLSALDKLGVKHIRLVETQCEPDGNFPTCPSPNPEYLETFSEAFNACEDDGNIYDMILATDPDSDRLGVVVKTGNGNYKQLTGNQVGELMFDYVLRCHENGVCGKNLDGKKVAFKSHVSSPLVEEIGKAYGVEVKNVFTGFKNIALEIERLNADGRADDFLFGFEESMGYLYGDYTRDKDGIIAAQMICLMAAEQRSSGKTLLDRLNEIYEQYSYIESITESLEFKTEKQRKIIDSMVEALFAGNLKSRDKGQQLIKKETCYRRQKMYCADLAGGHRIIIRPSGTELKLKIYIFAKGKTRDEAADKAAELSRWIRDVLEDKI